MSKKLYVGNLAETVTEEKLLTLFSEKGAVIGVKIMMDKVSNTSRGFGFVDMEIDREALAAIDSMNNVEVDGKKITVSEVQTRGRQQ